MKKNPYAKKISFRSPVVGTELKRPGSTEHFVGANGDLNANSKADLFKQMAAFLKRALGEAYRQVHDLKVKELVDRRYDRLQSYGRFTDTKADSK